MSRVILSRQQTSVSGLFTAWDDVVARNNSLAPHVEALDRDMRAKLVWADPDNLEKAAASADAAKWHDKAKQLRADAVVLRERMKTRTPVQITSEITWSRGWTDFYHAWSTFKAQVAECVTFDALGSGFCFWSSPNEGMAQHNQYDSNFRNFYQEFRAKFGAPTLAPPKTAAEIEAEHPKAPIIGSGGSIIDIPWTPILVIAGLFAATQFLGGVGPKIAQIRR
jgi:hypothetical protein